MLTQIGITLSKKELIMIMRIALTVANPSVKQMIANQKKMISRVKTTYMAVMIHCYQMVLLTTYELKRIKQIA